ncbi:AraC family transcriptional regulator [Sphaerisporangium corydalis]|uniref:AraC family transcriptional regulator n=1 Tax=Sphaerisporangium corydalis TaxID=1441875 RepID=A0ABV9EJR2_9ACTN|nr:AraC family transcriptional regulator [Sphaerisporangium corydalis]
MDVLSDVIATMRTGEPRSALVEWHAPWGQSYPPMPSAGFQVILQGSCWLIPPEGAPLALGVGDVVFLPYGRGHALADSPSTPLNDVACDPHDSGYERRYASPPAGRRRPDDPGAVTVTLCGAYQLDPARAHPLLTDLPEIVHLPARLGHHPELRAAVELLGGELDRPRLGADAVVPALLDMLLLFILRAWFDEQPHHGTPTGWAAALNDPAVSAALHDIHHDPGHPWTVEELGARAGLSRAAFARRFAALVGRPPLAYLTWWRMTTAARLLLDSDAPLTVVAERVGYSSEFAFANAFKREYGTAPGRYRRQEHLEPATTGP